MLSLQNECRRRQRDKSHYFKPYPQDIYKGVNTPTCTRPRKCAECYCCRLLFRQGQGNAGSIGEVKHIHTHTINTIFRMKNTLLKDLKALALQGLKQGTKRGERGRKKAVSGAAKGRTLGKAQGTRTGKGTRSGANIINLNINFINAPVSDTHNFYAPVGQVANNMLNNIKEQQKGE